MSDPVIYSAMIEAGGKRILNGDPSQLFPWWSYTKTVLAAGALQLVGQGRLRLDDVLPGRPYALRQLLRHRAGVPNSDSFRKPEPPAWPRGIGRAVQNGCRGG